MMTLKRTERRAADQVPSGTYTPGIVRIEKSTTEALGVHDEELGKITEEKWQRAYSLLDHSTKVSRVMYKIGEVRQEEDEILRLGGVAGLLHDAGKMNPACHIYRLNRVLTPEEKVVIDTHSIYSNLFVLDMLPRVRVEDRTFLADVAKVVRYHHNPWNLRDPIQRIKGFDLKFADFFVSMQETRHRPGLSQFEAITALEEFVLKEIKDPVKASFAPEMHSSLQTIARIYGPPKEIFPLR